MNPDTQPFLAELTALILDASEKPLPEGGLQRDEVLFGTASRLGLDSLDALQISMAILKSYGIRMADSKDTRRAMASLDTLAAFLLDKGAVPKHSP